MEKYRDHLEKRSSGRQLESGRWLLNPKLKNEENFETLSQFQTISLSNVKGKILLSVLANRMTRYMLTNNCIDMAVKKGGVPGVSSCTEHIRVLIRIIRKQKKENWTY